MTEQEETTTEGRPTNIVLQRTADVWASMVASRPTRRNLPSDLVAGLTFAAVNIPQGLAYALMSGVNPVFGLYTLMIGTPVAALATGSILMNVSSTSALAASTGDALQYYYGDQRMTALVTLVLLIGVFQLLLGIFKLGFIMQFVPNSVMVGFAHGVAVLIILGQLGDLTGYYSTQGNKVLQLADLLLHRQDVHVQTLIVGLLTVGLILLLDHNPNVFVRRTSLFAAMIIASIFPWLMGWDTVAQVRGITAVPQSLPLPVLPDLRYVPGLLLPAAALGILGLVQGAAVAQMFPNPNGKFGNVSRDFIGQGVANLATGFFQGIPAGGSTSGTAVVVGAGARSRWANIFAGLWVVLIVLLFGTQAESIAMPALAGLLIVVGARMVNPRAVLSVWHTGLIPRVSAGITFISALMVPLQLAILVGVMVAVLLHVFNQSQKVVVADVVWSDTLFPEERPVRQQLTDQSITVLQVYGSLFFAAAGTIEKLLPAVDDARRAVVILLLRGHNEVGSTIINALVRYAKRLQANEGKLILAGISETAYQQLDKTGALDLIGAENAFLAEQQWGAAAQKAYRAALDWLGDDAPPAPAMSRLGETAVPILPATTAVESQPAQPSELPDRPEPNAVPGYEPPSARDRLLYLEELERLADLQTKGIVTAEEFAMKKRQILGL